MRWHFNDELRKSTTYDNGDSQFAGRQRKPGNAKIISWYYNEDIKVATLTAVLDSCVDNTRHDAAAETALLFTHKALKFCKEYTYMAYATVAIQLPAAARTDTMRTDLLQY